MKRHVYFLLFIIPCYLFPHANNESFNISDYLIPSFEKAMGNDKNFKKYLLNNNKRWVTIKNLYESIAQQDVQVMNKLRIPKIIHQIWVGSPLPEKYKILQATWKKFHPDWEYKLWTDKDIEELKLENEAIYTTAKNNGKKADIARIEILYRFGGVYADTDFECLKPFDPLHYLTDFYFGFVSGENPLFFNGLIGSKPGHPILRRYIDQLKVSPSRPETFLGIHHHTGPFFFTACVLDELAENESDVLILPAIYFYPFPANQRHIKDREKIFKWVRSESFAIHYWHISWNNGKI